MSKVPDKHSVSVARKVQVSGLSEGGAELVRRPHQTSARYTRPSGQKRQGYVTCVKKSRG